jgi:D-methionine transport system permease protein
MFEILLKATQESLLLILGAGFLTVIYGLPLGFLATLTDQKKILENRAFHRLLLGMCHIASYLPFVMIMLFCVPLFKNSTPAASQDTFFITIVALTLMALPAFIQTIYQSTQSIPDNLVHVARSAGANFLQVVLRVYYPESKSKILIAVGDLLVQLTTYSTIAGLLGAPGLGALAYSKSIETFYFSYILSISLILMVFSYSFHAISAYFIARSN